MFPVKLLIKVLLAIAPLCIIPFGYKYLYSNNVTIGATGVNPLSVIQQLLNGNTGGAIPQIPVNGQPGQQPVIGGVKQMMPEAVKPLLKPDEAKDDSISPKDNPGDWDYIENTSQKCWFHKRTRKKVCEIKK